MTSCPINFLSRHDYIKLRECHSLHLLHVYDIKLDIKLASIPNSELLKSQVLTSKEDRCALHFDKILRTDDKESALLFSEGKIFDCALRMTFNLEESKLADQKSRDLVFGFIKEAQRLFPIDTYYNIPALITHVCLVYYYIKEYFDPELMSEHIQFEDGETKKFSSKTYYSNERFFCRSYNNDG